VQQLIQARQEPAVLLAELIQGLVELGGGADGPQRRKEPLFLVLEVLANVAPVEAAQPLNTQRLLALVDEPGSGPHLLQPLAHLGVLQQDALHRILALLFHGVILAQVV